MKFEDLFQNKITKISPHLNATCSVSSDELIFELSTDDIDNYQGTIRYIIDNNRIWQSICAEGGSFQDEKRNFVAWLSSEYFISKMETFKFYL